MNQIIKIELKTREKEDKIFYKILIALSFMAILPLFYTIIDVFFRGAISLSFYAEPAITKAVFSSLFNSVSAVVLPIVIMLPLAFTLLYFYSIYNEVKTNRFIKYLMHAFSEFPTLLFVAALYLLDFNSFMNNSYLALAIILLIIIFPKFCIMLFDSFDEIDRNIISAAIAMGAKNRTVFFKIILPSFNKTILTDLMKIFAITFGLTIPYFAIERFFSEESAFLQGAVLSEILKFPHENQNFIFAGAFLILVVYLITNLTSLLLERK